MLPQTMIIDKKKRTSTSGSRSKSKKSTNNIKNDQTVQLKPKQSHHIFQNQDICAKIKTQNSLSINKSKGSKKNSKSLKKPLLNGNGKSFKQSKDQSYLVSAQRKHSINKINKTQTTHTQSQDIFKKLYSIKKQLTRIQIPNNFSINQIQTYFNQLKQFFTSLSIQPLQSVLLQVHSMYINPIQNIFSMIKPYQSMLKRKQQITKLIKDQIQQNEKLYQQLDPDDIEIIKLKQKILKNTQLIESIKKSKKNSPNNKIMMKKKKSLKSENQNNYIDISSQSKHTNNILNSSKLQKHQNNNNNNQQYQRKLVKQYQKLPKFQQDNIHSNNNKKINNFINNNNSQQKNYFNQEEQQYSKYSFLQKSKSKSKQNLDIIGGSMLNNKEYLISYQKSHSKEKTYSQVSQQEELGENIQQKQIQNQQDKTLFHKKQKSSAFYQNQYKNDQELIRNEQSQQDVLQIHQQQRMGMKSGGLSFNFKLDIPKIDRSNIGFHDQFYSKLDQFSQSWRNQALRQKRF